MDSQMIVPQVANAPCVQPAIEERIARLDIGADGDSSAVAPLGDENLAKLAYAKVFPAVAYNSDMEMSRMPIKVGSIALQDKFEFVPAFAEMLGLCDKVFGRFDLSGATNLARCTQSLSHMKQIPSSVALVASMYCGQNQVLTVGPDCRFEDEDAVWVYLNCTQDDTKFSAGYSAMAGGYRRISVGNSSTTLGSVLKSMSFRPIFAADNGVKYVSYIELCQLIDIGCLVKTFSPSLADRVVEGYASHPVELAIPAGWKGTFDQLALVYYKDAPGVGLGNIAQAYAPLGLTIALFAKHLMSRLSYDSVKDFGVSSIGQTPVGKDGSKYPLFAYGSNAVKPQPQTTHLQQRVAWEVRRRS
jgi:hypothetical protein